MSDTIWILIPLAPFLLGGFAIWSKHQQKMIEKQSELTATSAASINMASMAASPISRYRTSRSMCSVRT